MNKHIDINVSSTEGDNVSGLNDIYLDAGCVSAVAAAVGTPFYCYSPQVITQS